MTGNINLALSLPKNALRDWSDEEVLQMLKEGEAVTHTTPCNPSQKKAVLAAVRQTLCLIQGPLGTGKTKVGALVAKAIEKRTHKLWQGHLWMILTTADGHVPDDNMVKGFRNFGVLVLRAAKEQKSETRRNSASITL